MGNKRRYCGFIIFPEDGPESTSNTDTKHEKDIRECAWEETSDNV
jgi:hypothetical protein